MNLVIDANILFSVMIKKGKTEDLLLDSQLKLFAPQFIFEEFSKYELYLSKKTGRSQDEFEKLVSVLKKYIETVEKNKFKEFILLASEISPDINDVDYIALALKLKCPLWSNDKVLKNQNLVPVYSTYELLTLLG